MFTKGQILTAADLNNALDSVPTTGTPSSGFVSLATGPKTAKWAPSRIISAAAFPNVVGDGSFDDTIGLNAAFAYGSNNNVAIGLMNRHRITSTLFATPPGSSLKSCHVVGAGRG